MITHDLRLDFVCELHNLPIISFCKSCDIFMCNQCGKSHSQEHREMITSDLKGIVYQKLSSALEYQESRKRCLDQLSLVEGSLTHLVQRLAESHIILKSQQKQLQEQSQKDRELVQTFNLMKGSGPVKPEIKDKFFKTLKAYRPPLNQYIDEQQGLVNKFDSLASLLNKDVFELPKRHDALEMNGSMSIENESKDFPKSSPPDDLPAMLFFIESQPANPTQSKKGNQSASMQLERTASHKSYPSHRATSTGNEINPKENSERTLKKPGKFLSPVVPVNSLQSFPKDQAFDSSTSLKISIPKKFFEKKPEVPLESPGQKNQLAQSNLDPPMTFQEKIKKSSKNQPPIYQDRALLINLIRKYAPKLLQKTEVAKDLYEDRVSQQALDEFFFSPNQQSMVENLSLSQEWKDVLELLLVESGKLKHRKVLIEKNSWPVIIKTEHLLSCKLDQETPEIFADIIHSMPTMSNANYVLAEIANSVICLPNEEMQRNRILCKLLSWMRGFLEEYKRLQKLQPKEYIDVQVNKKILAHVSRSINSLLRRVNRPSFEATKEIHIWALLTGVLVSLRIGPMKLWNRLTQVGNLLSAKGMISERCPILKGINDFVTDKQFIMSCSRRLTQESIVYERKNVTASLFLIVLEKQRELNRISRTLLPEALRKIPASYSQLIKTYKAATAVQDPNYVEVLKQQLHQFPYKLPEIQKYVDTLEAKSTSLTKLLTDHTSIPPIDWAALLQSSEDILRLSTELKRPLPSKLEHKLVLISSISKNPVISGLLRTDTRYQQVIVVKHQIEELSQIDSCFMPQNKFFRINIWLSTVRLVKAVLDKKIEKMEPLLSETEIRELDKEGTKFFGKNSDSRKDLSDKQHMTTKLIKNLEEKLNELGKIKNPKEWLSFNRDFLGVVDLKPQLAKKKEELSSKFKAKEFEGQHKGDLAETEMIEPILLDDFIPDLDLIERSKRH